MSTSDQSGKSSTLLSQMGPFEHLFRQHYAFVCNIVFKYVADQAKVEDIAQEIFTELWLKRDQIEIHTSVQAYLRRMAVTRALNYLRDTKKHNWDDLDQVTESGADSSQQPEVLQKIEGEELKKILDDAINRLPEKCRVIFMMSRYDEMTYSEISGELHISIKTVENQIGKALKYLRTALIPGRGKG